MTKTPTEDAIRRLHELATTTPLPVVLARLAEHEEALRHFARALDTWRILLSLNAKWLSANPELKKRAEEAVPRLQALVATLVVTTPQNLKNVQILLGDVNVSPVALSEGFELDAGDYLLAVTATGQFPWVEPLHLSPGSRVVRKVLFKHPPAEMFTDVFGSDEAASWRPVIESSGAIIDGTHAGGCKTGTRCIEAKLAPNAKFTIAYASPFSTKNMGQLTFSVRSTGAVEQVAVEFWKADSPCDATTVRATPDWRPIRIDFSACQAEYASGISFRNVSSAESTGLLIDDILFVRGAAPPTGGSALPQRETYKRPTSP